MYELFNPTDYWLANYLAQFAQQNRFFDESVVLIEKIEFLKGGVLVALLWYLWFQPTDDPQRRHEKVLRIIFGGILAVLVSQMIQGTAPYRPLPIGNPEVDFVAAFGHDYSKRNFWAGFPSDTTLFTVALASGVLALSRPLGIFAFLWTLVIIVFPRLYLGYHFLSDIIVGGLIGAFLIWFSLWVPLPRFVLQGVHWLEHRLPAWFYLAGFILSFQLAGTFSDIRTITKLIPTDLGDATRHIPWCERNTAEPRIASVIDFPTPDGTRNKRTSKEMVLHARAAIQAGKDDEAMAWIVACQAHNPRAQDEFIRDRAAVLQYLRDLPEP